jgi:hypothetical protein
MSLAAFRLQRNAMSRKRQTWKRQGAMLYSPSITNLLSSDSLAPLGPGNANEAVRHALQNLTVESAFAPLAVGDQEMAACCLAGLWLFHGFLDNAHNLCQDIETASGSYWHALVHRREPDYANAAYWFRRVGQHPIFPELRQAAADLGAGMQGQPAAAFLGQQRRWDPFAFVDLCAQVAGEGSPTEMLCRQIQRREWEQLFGFCHRHALKGE